MTADRPRHPWTQTIDAGAQLRAARAALRRPHLIRRGWDAAGSHLSAAPGSVAYAFTLFVTWWTLRGISDAAGHLLILANSTNLHNMRQQPVQVVISSAFWTDGGFPWTVIMGFLVVMAAAERWLGTARWIALFATGHIGATLITVFGIDQAIDRGILPERVAQASDVGASYGFFAVLAALTFRFRGRIRALWPGILAVVLGVAAWVGQTFTDYGHVCAAVIGFVIAAVAVVISRRLDRAASTT